MPDDQVETREILWSELCDAADPGRERENELRPYVYFFGGGRIQKREGLGPYGEDGVPYP